MKINDFIGSSAVFAYRRKYHSNHFADGLDYDNQLKIFWLLYFSWPRTAIFDPIPRILTSEIAECSNRSCNFLDE